MKGTVLRLSGISKAFAGVHALKDVSLELNGGAILGLVGQNGAGKSTLMNIIGGVLKPDAGNMEFASVSYAPSNPGDAAKHGIAFIHQELSLFTNLTIAENIFLARFPIGRFGALIDRAVLHERVRELLKQVNLDLEPQALVSALSPGERQLVEVARALQLDADIIIFDEPTTSLTARETKRLFTLIKQLRKSGKAIIYISHILADVLALADDIVILRDGEVVAGGPAEKFTVSGMVLAMVGRSLEQLYPPRLATPKEEVLLSAHKITAHGIINDVSFELHRGEILGLFGLMGSGRTELARILFGIEPHDAGRIAIAGEVLTGQSPLESIQHGIAFVTENRRAEGLLLEASIADNVALAALSDLSVSTAGFIETDRLQESVRVTIDGLSIKAPSLRIPAKNLSGGNQQKVVLAKWLLCNPSVFIVDEPTRGIDVGAKFEIYSIIDRLATDKGGVFFISSELEELLAICDRILVMSKGEIVGRFARAGFDRERILAAAFGEARDAA
jgi:ribose transport system ATP-binding protein